MEEFKAKYGEWLYMPALGQVVCVGRGVIAELIVTGNEDENGRKMAAAPELLEALQQLLIRIADDEEYGPDHAITVARKAIAKALGK